ncbi:MAG: hypothetical protein ABR968_10860 [Bacteroidales bacterium]|jgi:hypothetical protein
MKTKNLKSEPISYSERFLMTFIMMSIMRNPSKINLKLLKVTDPTDYVIKECLGLKTTGVAAMAACPTTDTMVHTAANLLQTMDNGTLLKPQLYTSNQVLGQKKTTVDLYNKVINFMKGACNDASIAAGDITAGINLANTCGGRLTKKVGGKQPDFGVIAVGPGWVLVHAKKCRRGVEGHIFRVAIVSGKGVIPAKGSYTDCVSLEGTIQLSDLSSGTILAINHTSVVPVSRTKSPFVIPTAKTKKTAKATITDKHHPIFSITSPDPYIWDGWIYIGIQ